MPIAVSGSQITFNDNSVQTSAARAGGTNTTSAVDITLTATSTQVQNVIMTAANKYVILPDATTMQKGAVAFVITNSGNFGFGVKNSAGGILRDPPGVFGNGVQPNSTFYCLLIDNATAAGVWYIQNYIPAANVASWGAPNVSSIVSDSGSGIFDCCTLSATQVLIAYKSAATTASLVIATISGTSVTFGTPVTVFTTGYGLNISARVIGLSSTSAALFTMNSGNTLLYGWAISISGSTITVGTATSSGVNTINGYRIQKDTSSTGLIAYATAITAINLIAFSVSGTTITFGTASTNAITFTSGASTFSLSLVQLAAGSYIVLGGNDAFAELKHRGVSLSGTSITLGTTTTTDTVWSGTNVGYTFTPVFASAGSGWGSAISSGFAYNLQYSGTTYVANSAFLSYGGAGNAALISGKFANFGTSNTAVAYQDTNGNAGVTVFTPNTGGTCYTYSSQTMSYPFYGNSGFGSAQPTITALGTNTLFLLTSTRPVATSGTFYMTAQILSMY